MHVRYIVGAALVFAAMAMAAVASYFTSQVAYFTVDEMFARPGVVPDGLAHAVSDSAQDRSRGYSEDGGNSVGDAASPADLVGDGPRYQVRGNLDLATVQRPDEGLGMRFVLFGKNGRLPVAYRGVVPDTFEKAESVTVGGRFAADGTFVADELLVQCPSKYQAKLGTATPPSPVDFNG